MVKRDKFPEIFSFRTCILQVFCCLSLGSVDSQPQLGDWIKQMLGMTRNPNSAVKYRLVQERESLSEDSLSGIRLDVFLLYISYSNLTYFSGVDQQNRRNIKILIQHHPQMNTEIITVSSGKTLLCSDSILEKLNCTFQESIW